MSPHHAFRMDDDFLDLIDQAFLEGQIDGETMELTYLWLIGSGSNNKKYGVWDVSGENHYRSRCGRKL